MAYMEYSKIEKESMIILLLLAGLMAGSIESNLTKAFDDPEWMNNKKEEEK